MRRRRKTKFNKYFGWLLDVAGLFIRPLALLRK
jgi:hypothetical protein